MRPTTPNLPPITRPSPTLRWLALAVLLAAVACGKTEKEGAATKPGAEAAPADGDRLIVGTTADVDGLNPVILTTLTAQEVADLLFWPLGRFNPDFLTYRPGLADSWEFSPDSLSLTFHLNPKITWHDGVPLRAEDVVWSVGACKDEKVAWSAIRWLDRIKSVTAVDSVTVRFDYTERYPYQLADAVVCLPMPKHLLASIKPEDLRNASFNSNPVGDGPFKFKAWNREQSVELVANDAFFKGRPHLDGIVWRIIPEWTTLITQLVGGNVDFVEGIQPQFYKQLEADPHLTIYAAAGRRYVFVAWNLVDPKRPGTPNPLFADRDVRRALTMGIDRQAIIDALLYGQGKVMNGPILDILWAYDPDLKGLPYDPEGAKRLLAQAGWKDTDGDGIVDKDGRPFRFDILTNADNTLRVDITVAIQSQLKKIGVDARPRGMEFVVFQQKLQSKDFQAAVAGWNSGIKVDLTDLWHSKAIKDKFNFISYSNPAVDSLNDVGIAEFDTQKAKKIWSQAQQIIADDAGYTFLFEQYDIHALDKRFRNVEINAGGWTYNVEDWYVPKGEQKY